MSLPSGLIDRLPERDPTGRDAHTPGAKLDAGKVRASLARLELQLRMIEQQKAAAERVRAASDAHINAMRDLNITFAEPQADPEVARRKGLLEVIGRVEVRPSEPFRYPTGRGLMR